MTNEQKAIFQAAWEIRAGLNADARKAHKAAFSAPKKSQLRRQMFNSAEIFRDEGKRVIEEAIDQLGDVKVKWDHPDIIIDGVRFEAIREN